MATADNSVARISFCLAQKLEKVNAPNENISMPICVGKSSENDYANDDDVDNDNTTQRNTEAAAASAVNVAVARTTIAELTCPHQEKILEWIIVSSGWGLSVLYKQWTL